MKKHSQTVRMIILGAAFVLVLLLYCLRLLQMQVVEGEDSEALLERGWSSTQVIKAARGEILDRNGRPLAMNAIGRDVVINRAFLEPKDTNAVILRLIRIMEEADEDWIDNLPITEEAPFRFKDQQTYATEIARLKNAFDLGQFATVDDVIYHLKKTYNLETYGDPENPQHYTDEEFRKIAGVRYEMTQRGFSMSVPYTFATDIKIETVPKIKERSFEIPGVDVVESPIRQYVSGDIAPHIIGSVGPIYKEVWDGMKKETVDGQVYATREGRTYQMNDVMGKDGAELAFEQYLKGVDGERKIVQNSRGDVIDIVEEEAQVPGSTVVLTIDSQLQKVAQDSLASNIKRLNETKEEGKGKEAQAGAVAVVECETGEILALATHPSYSLVNFQRDYEQIVSQPNQPLFNRALSAAYTPGSSFKPAVSLAALASGTITPSTRFNCTHVYNRFAPGYTPYCESMHGQIDVVRAIQGSCNIFYYETAYYMGIETLDEYAARLGFGVPTGIELPENIGQVASPEVKAKSPAYANDPTWWPGDVIQAGIGQQATTVSPLQLANYTAALANDGKRMKATILKSVRSYSFDETIYEHTAEIAEEIDAPEAFATVRQGMVAASGVGGTASGTFANYPIQVASKTGTPERGDGLFNSVFIAYAPANDPKIAVAVVVEKGWEGFQVAPVARDIFDAYFFSQNSKSSAEADYGVLLS
ncbi:penicillin-binding transpeptidase domain-containing protein [Anaerotruncus rubiinfantis]|uniref:penicillin-binding transpeptidase domain-containing protein n=1 Tax=Anaerotruncus rubiinfantis TaxID=1720200 RepID=UPI003D7A782A